MGGLFSRPSAPSIPKRTPQPELQPVPDIVDFVSGQETLNVTDGTGKKKRVVRALPKELIADIVPEMSKEDQEKLASIPFLDKITDLPRILKNPKERNILLRRLKEMEIPSLSQIDMSVLGKRLLGQFANNIETLQRLDPQGTAERYGPQLEAYRQLQERALEKNFDLARAQQEEVLAQSGLSKSATAADLRARTIENALQQRNDMENKLLLMADELKSQELQRNLAASQDAQGLTKLGAAERQQEIEKELSSVQQDLQARQQDLAADQASQQLDLADEGQRLQAEQANQTTALAAETLNRQVGLQENQQQLERRGQNFQREGLLRGQAMTRSPLLQGLQEFDTVNSAQINRAAADNNAKFTRSQLEQNKFQMDQQQSSPFGAVLKGGSALLGGSLGRYF